MSTQDKTIPIDRRIDIQEASRLSGKSERTLRRWYHQGKLKAVQENGHNSPLWFDRQQIAALAGSTALTARMEMLEARVSELERIVQEMQAASRVTMPVARTRPGPELEVKSKPAAAVPSPDSQDLPAGTMTLSEFGWLHNVNRRTLTEWVVREKFDHMAVEIINRPGQFNRYVTIEQQRAILAFWDEHGKPGKRV